MVVRRVKKGTKRRGLHTYHGAKKKWRGAGSRGGRGRAGLMKHKKSLVTRFNPAQKGVSLHKRQGHKFGFKIPQKIQRIYKINSINVRDIDRLTRKLGLKEINLADYNFQKVLSGGRLTRALTIKAAKFSEKAKQEIEASGGKVIEG
ncbi:MAG: uL15 family ribosomal protein [Candidatus Thermoplasmatota archaeon]|nr:uL15 family ribosomal protein [Candidatus Thermoplasmatota archaeon]